MFQFDMTDEQVKAAKAAGRLARLHLSGTKLHEALTIGESLLVGRTAAMKAAKVNVPNGRAYAEYFAKWKQTYRFPEGKEAKDFYDQCIVCAEHREIADAIITGLSIKDKVKVGIWGLAKRVRARLREEVEGPREDIEGPAPPRKSQIANAEEIRLSNEIANLRKENNHLKEHPFSWWNGSAKEASRSIFQNRGDSGRYDGKGRQLIVALAQDFKDLFPSFAGALLDELTRILKGDQS